MNKGLIFVFIMALAFLCPDYIFAAAGDSKFIISAGVGTIMDGADIYVPTAGVASEEKLVTVISENLDTDGDNSIAGYDNLGISHVSNHLNIRKEADEKSDLVGKMTNKCGCEILEVDGDWLKIKSGKVEGYAKSEFIYTGRKAIEAAEEALTLMATVNTTTLFVREFPDKDARVMTMVPMGESYEVTEGSVSDNWVKVAIDEDEGYISTEFVSIAEQLDTAVTLTELKFGDGVSDVRVSLVNYAKQFLGNKYVWGGTSLTNGCDCSGYVQSIFRKYGVSLPRTSYTQVNSGKKISASEAKPGDLFFYSKYGRINHVAIYIGNGQVINAASKKLGIRINSAYYRKPAAVRRVLP